MVCLYSGDVCNLEKAYRRRSAVLERETFTSRRLILQMRKIFVLMKDTQIEKLVSYAEKHKF